MAQEHDRGCRPILIGMGANLPSAQGPPRATLEAALDGLQRRGVRILARSRFWSTRPEPDDGQPWYVNAAAMIDTELAPGPLLDLLLRVEQEFGRVRLVKNGARSLDLDLLAYRDLVNPGPEPPILPHPRLALRAFVLMPLNDIVPAWRHPATGRDLPAMLAALPPGQSAMPQS